MYNANEQTNYFMKQKPGLNYSDLRANFQEKLKSFPQQLHVVWNEYFENDCFLGTKKLAKRNEPN